MTPVFLRFLNAPLLILIAILGVALQTTIFSSYPLLYLQPDLILLLVVWLGLKREFLEGGVLTLVLAEIAEAHSGAPRGLFLLSYMALYLAVRWASQMFLIQGLIAMVGLTLIASIFWKLFGLCILHVLERSSNQWRHTLALLLPGAVIEAALGIWVYRWLEYWDRITTKDPRSRKALQEDLQLDEEGL
jgi:rod shape-determining protein MreD